MSFSAAICNAINEICQMDIAQIGQMLEVPPSSDMGDYAFPCFALAKVMRKAPPLIAQELSQQIKAPACVEKIEVKGGYLNFFLNKATLAQETLDSILARKEQYGSSKEGEGKTICIDYSSINIAKPFHIGHLSTTVIGAALYRMYRFLGYKTVGINHLGDWGTQFGKLIYAYKKWSSREEIEADPLNNLQKIYVRFHDEAEKNPDMEDEARKWFKRIEDDDPEAMELFNWFKDITLKEVSKIYDMLGITFDSYAGESFYNDKMEPVVDELKEKNLLVQSQGAYVVPLDDYSLPPCLILKSDGATLYATRDLAAAFYRKATYDFHKCLYVVAYQQNLHFSQFFKVVELMGYEWAKDLEHVAYGMVSLEDGAMSTRKGKVVLLEDLLKRSVSKTYEIIEGKNPDLENKEEVARQVGIGAVIFNTLYAGRIKDYVFSWDRALNFDGESGPYVQYTHARCTSVLAKGGEITGCDGSQLTDASAQELVKLLAAFPEIVTDATHKNEPSVITRHIAEIAKAYNKFYYDNRILDADDAVRSARLSLTKATQIVLKTGLGLLGISAPDKM